MSFKLTPETIKRTGTRVTAELTSVRLQNLAPLGNAGAIWMQNNAMSARELMEMRGVRDPDAVFAEREYELTLLDPEVQKLRRLSIMRERDPEVAQMYEQMMLAKQQPQGGAGMPPGGGGPMGAPPVAPNTSAMNLQALGMGQVGPTGRPAGPAGVPPGAMLQGTDVGP
jgi:hypothetical protein